MKKSIYKVTTLLFTLFISLSTKAQFYSGMDLDFMTLQHSTYMSSVNLINANSDYFAEQRRSEANSSGAAVRAAAKSKAFSYSPSSTVSTKVKKGIIDQILKKNPNSLLAEALNAKNNPFPRYVSLLNSLGLDVQHNYADAFTAYMLGMWRIANKMSANPTKEQIDHVREQVKQTMDLRAWTNTQKQEAAEHLIYNLIFANEPYEGSRLSGNKTQLQADSDAVQNRFLNEHRLNLRNMTIAQAGLVPRH